MKESYILFKPGSKAGEDNIDTQHTRKPLGCKAIKRGKQ